MRRFKRLAALFMAVAMLMTCAATTAVAGWDDEAGEWVHFYWDAPEEVFREHSINDEWNNISNSYIFSTPARVSSVVATTPSNDFGAFTSKILSITQNGNKWFTKIWLDCWPHDFPEPFLMAADDVGKKIPVVLTVTLDDGQIKTFDFSIIFIDRPTVLWTGAGADALEKDGLPVGQSVSLKAEILDKAGVLNGKNVNYTWTLNNNTIDAEKTFAKVAADGDTAIVTGLAVGNTYLSANATANGVQITSYGRWFNVTGTIAPTPGPDLDNAKDDLAAGNDAALDVAPNKGLSPSDLLDLKSAAGSSGAKVELTFNNDSDLTLSFDPAAIPDDWSGPAFTPAFTPDMPEAAKNQGFSYGMGKWLDFAHSGALPAPMTVTMKVAPGTFSSSTTELKVWYFDPATKALVEQPLAVLYDAATGTVTFTLEHFSAYLLCADGVNPNENKKPPVVDSGHVRDSGSGSEDDSNSPENLRLVAEQATWNKTFAALASADSLAALPSGTAVINGQTVTAPMLTINADQIKQIPAFVIDRLAGKNALLKFTGKGLADSFVHGAAVKPTTGNRIFYRVEDFLALYAPQE